MIRTHRSDDYNWSFDTETGLFARWGKDLKDDPKWAPIGPEILDIEISYGSGCLGNCKYCYKGNNGSGRNNANMTFDQFVNIFQKMRGNLTQIAFGIMDIGTNPDFFKMMEFSRSNGVIPNYTCHGLDVTPEIAKKTSELCGAVAVSIVDKDKSFDAIKMFSDAGMKQVNIHFVLAEETVNNALDLIADVAYDYRTAGVNAIVFLQYKPKGKNPSALTPIQDYRSLELISNKCKEYGIGCGFDSCSAPLFLKTLKQSDPMSMLVEPCESGLFSSYVNADGDFFPCSFSEDTPGWEKGISVLECKDFVKEVWCGDRMTDWSDALLASSKNCNCPWSSQCRSCPVYNISACKKG